MERERFIVRFCISRGVGRFSRDTWRVKDNVSSLRTGVGFQGARHVELWNLLKITGHVSAKTLPASADVSPSFYYWRVLNLDGILWPNDARVANLDRRQMCKVRARKGLSMQLRRGTYYTHTYTTYNLTGPRQLMNTLELSDLNVFSTCLEFLKLIFDHQSYI